MASTATGAILWKEHYSPLGERQVKSSSSTKNSQYFHGKEQDTTTGLQYFGARWYDPMVGRFMAVDPAAVDAEDEGDSGLVHEFNRYAFVANNPHKYIDPDGAMTVNNGNSGNAPRHAVTGAQYNPILGYTFGGAGRGGGGYKAAMGRGLANNLDFNSVGGGVGGVGVKVSVRNTPYPRASIWTSTKSSTALENALGHWNKHKAEYPALKNAMEYVQATFNFLHNSPKGTLVKTRSNGDILKYNPKTNDFGVMDANGTPRTMFKPNDGMKYWEAQ